MVGRKEVVVAVEDEAQRVRLVTALAGIDAEVVAVATADDLFQLATSWRRPRAVGRRPHLLVADVPSLVVISLHASTMEDPFFAVPIVVVAPQLSPDGAAELVRARIDSLLRRPLNLALLRRALAGEV